MHGVLLYDTKREEGKVRLFPTLPDGVMGADILLDWIHDLKEEYNERVKGL
jgi:hypothetical protein